jgi:hypothetical protein
LGVIPAQLAAFGQQRHRVHQVLQRDDAHQALIFDYRDNAEIARGEFAEGGGQRFLPGRDFNNLFITA